jgi:hypothetical protein
MPENNRTIKKLKGKLLQRGFEIVQEQPFLWMVSPATKILWDLKKAREHQHQEREQHALDQIEKS